MDSTRQYVRWMDREDLDPELREDLIAVRDDRQQIEERFYAPLAFGTAGLRGLMRAGINSVNIYTISQATQGLANLIAGVGPDAMRRGVAIAYDCRRHSRRFAEAAACVLAAADIHVYLFDELRPTPELSFAILHLSCIAGINVTASHNPKQYNGYKVYWEDGAQLPPDHAKTVAEQIARTDIFDGVKTMPYETAVSAGLVTILGGEIDRAFLDRVLALSCNPGAIRDAADRFRLVYTPFHGCGYRLVPAALREAGFKNIVYVDEQMVPDGSFPTVKSPNPEDTEGFALAIETARRENVDLIIGTDPDADRVGVAELRPDGSVFLFSGNQIGVLLLDYLIRSYKENGRMPPHPFAVKTIVTTEMARAVGEAAGVPVYECFTGFKFIAEVINRLQAREGWHYLLGFEESIGYTMGDHCRDKDAVGSSMMIAEMAAWHSLGGRTLFDALQQLYEQYGHYREVTLNIRMEGLDGKQRMDALMRRLRQFPLRGIAGVPVTALRDYESGIRTETEGGTAEPMELSGSDVLYHEMEDGSSFIVRPSGTEPKVKVYILTRGESAEEADLHAERYRAAAAELIR